MSKAPHADAERIARRFHEVSRLLCREIGVPDPRWEDVDESYRQVMIWTFDEMLRAGLIFGGPSLYAEPSV
jgi:hypothetical protein